MTNDISLDGRTLTGVANDESGEVGADTVFHFEQNGERIYASYSGGSVVDGHLVGTFDGKQWDIRYTQINTENETATGHSIGDIELLNDGRIRVEDEWEWESKPGKGESVPKKSTSSWFLHNQPSTVHCSTCIYHSSVIIGRSGLSYEMCRSSRPAPSLASK